MCLAKICKPEVVQDLRSIFNAPDRASAEAYLKQVIAKYRPKPSRLVTWMENNIPSVFSVFAFPVAHRRIRTTNMPERINQESRCRTRVVNIFPNQAAYLHLVSTILMEMDEDWQTDRRYSVLKVQIF